MTCQARHTHDGERLQCMHDDPAHVGQHAAWPDGHEHVVRWSRSGQRKAPREGVQLSVWLPLDAVRALERLCAREAEATGRPATQLRTAVVVRALREAGRR